MHLAAHTNKSGTDYKYEDRYGDDTGVVFDVQTGQLEPFSWSYHRGTIPTAYSYKSGPVQGDKRSIYHYNRKVKKVITDEPYKERRVLHGGSELVYDYTRTLFLSVNHGPFGYDPVLSELMANSQAEADVKALNRLSETKIQLGADILLARQQVDMFADSVTKGAKFLLALKRGRLAEAARSLGLTPKQLKQNRGSDVANAWLQYSYGWKPLADNLYAHDDLVRQALRKERVIKASATSKYFETRRNTYRQEDWEISTNASVRTHIEAKFASALGQSLNDHGLINPLAIAWEVMPWSFAIDWFAPVGQTLEALSATVGLTFHRGWQTRHHHYTLQAKHKTGWFVWEVTEPGSYKEQGYEFEREPYNTFPVPRFFADTTPFSTPRALNALALVRQLYK